MRERCVLHATLASLNQELSPEDFCKHGPLGLQVHINGTIECPCFRIQSAQASEARELAVSEWQASPNPVTSFSPIAFSAQGAGITGVQVAVYNLLGIKLFESDKASGSSFIWNGVDRNGLPLANGVYLYRITAQGQDGHTLPSQLKKLVIRR
ncbi:T9SS type A sorting domain-containing protein [Candidatus Acetothermia bacterium]|nr:T9SS type A sorting domain-containing protein [Candidatus Acetothermia bacterium]